MGKNQTEFAKVTGVHLNTQSRYEKGERDPDTGYLSAIARAGVDVGYLLTGEKREDPWAETQAYVHIIATIQEFLDLAKGPVASEFQSAITEAHEASKHYWSDSDRSDQADKALWQVLKKSPVLLPELQDLEMLIEQVEFVQSTVGLDVTPRLKAKVVVTLYRSERISGRKPDFPTVERLLRSG